MRNVQSISVTIPTELLQIMAKMQKNELKSCSAITTEAIRQYIELKEYKRIQKELSLIAKAKGIITEEDIDRIIHEARSAKNKSRS